MARELQLRLYRIGINAHHWCEVHDGLTSAAIHDEDSVAIAISNTGRTDETIEMLAPGQRGGCPHPREHEQRRLAARRAGR